jgi:Holliday junction resolvase RusA-like endonuclease
LKRRAGLVEIEFKMHLQPPKITQQEHKIGTLGGRPYIYEPAELKDAREKLTAHLSKFKPPRKFQGPVKLTVTWYFYNPKVQETFAWRTKKPDTDNLDKMLKDCMTRLDYWEDDAQVACEYIHKLDTSIIEQTGIAIGIEELDTREV